MADAGNLYHNRANPGKPYHGMPLKFLKRFKVVLKRIKEGLALLLDQNRALFLLGYLF